MKNGALSVTMTGTTLLHKWCAGSLATFVWRGALWSLVRATAPSGWTMLAALEMRVPSLSATTAAWDSTTVSTTRTLELNALVSDGMEQCMQLLCVCCTFVEES